MTDYHHLDRGRVKTNNINETGSVSGIDMASIMKCKTVKFLDTDQNLSSMSRYQFDGQKRVGVVKKTKKANDDRDDLMQELQVEEKYQRVVFECLNNTISMVIMHMCPSISV